MKKCPFCGFLNLDENNFCNSCGRLLSSKVKAKRFILRPLDEQFASEYEIKKEKVLVGRALDCDLNVKHISVSRHHASLEFSSSDEKYILADLNSKNGTFVNGDILKSSHLLKSGDVIKFGEVSFEFIEEVEKESESIIDRFKLILSLNKVINSSLNLEDVLERVVDAALKITKAERAFLLVADSKNNLKIKLAKNIKGEWLNPKDTEISFKTANKVFKTGTSFITTDISDDQSIVFHKSVIKLGLNSVMAVPLRFKNKTTGVLYVDSKLAVSSFDKDDLEIFVSLSDQAAIAIENARLIEENKELLFSTIEALAESIEKRDPYTGGHTRRVLEISVEIAKKLNLDNKTIENIKLGALLHDIGKIGIDDKVLRKQGRLNDEEYSLIKQHPKLGYQIIKHIKQLKDAVPGVLYHHEKEDGTGYPIGLKGDDIPLIAKIISVADAFDAMTTDRPYRKGLDVKIAAKELVDNKEKQFSGEIVDAFLEVLKDKGYEFNF